MSNTEMNLALKLTDRTDRSEGHSLSSYARAAILNRPPEDRSIFRHMMNEQIKMNYLLWAPSNDSAAKERAQFAAEGRRT